MELQAVFEEVMETVDARTPARVLETCLHQLQEATQSHQHAWHVGMFTSISGASPQARVVVLRGVRRDPLTLRFHTDRRSAKIEQLQQTANVEWLFYHPATRVQLRLSGTARVSQEGDVWDAAWEATGVKSRRCYLGPHPPGQHSEVPTVNLPEGLADRDPTPEESEAGRANFAIVETSITSVDFLFLRHTGHLRCRFESTDDGWATSWLEP